MGTLPTCRHHGVSVSQVVARRLVRMHLRKIRDREYSRLRELIPSVASREDVTKLEILEEAVKYIDELHVALVVRFRQKHGRMAEGKAQEAFQNFVNRMRSKTSHAKTHSDSAPSPNRNSVHSTETQSIPANFLLWRNPCLDDE